MTTEQTPTEQAETPETQENVSRETSETQETQQQADPNAELRAYADRTKAENQTLRKELMKERLGQIGLDNEVGLGKAIAKEYDGEMDLDSIRKYAADEYQHQAGELPDPNQHADASTRAEALDGANTGTEAPKEPTQADEISEKQRRLTEPDAGPNDAKESVGAKLRGFVDEHMM